MNCKKGTNKIELIHRKESYEKVEFSKLSINLSPENQTYIKIENLENNLIELTIAEEDITQKKRDRILNNYSQTR